MAEVSKPGTKPRWATGGSAMLATPASGKQDSGWTTSTGDASGVPEKPPLQQFNWLARWTYEWLLYLESKTDLFLGAQAPSTLTLASDAVTPASSFFYVDTEAGAASDELRNIATTNLDQGRLIIIRTTNASRDVTVKHAAGGGGQIHLAYSADALLDNTNKFIILYRDGADWRELFRSWPEAPKHDSPPGQTLDIGTVNASTINIGRAGATVNLFGSVVSVEVVNTQIVDKLIRQNTGGAAGSGSDMGTEYEEGGVVTAYSKTSPDRETWRDKAPAVAGIRQTRAPSAGIFEGVVTKDSPDLGNVTIAAGTTARYGVLVIAVGETWTIDGTLICEESLTVNGTLTGSGKVITR